MQELSTTSTLGLFDTTKAQRQSFCIDIVGKLENGEADPLKIHLQVKAMEDLIKQLQDNTVYKRFLLDEAAKYGKSFEYINAKFEVKEMGVKYDYSQCGDPEMTELLRQETEIKEKVKARSEFLKTLPTTGLSIMQEDTGELVIVYPPSKTSTTTLTVKLP